MKKALISIAFMVALVLGTISINPAVAEDIPICTAPGSQYEPAIYGDKIIWSDARNGNSDIYMYDLSTGTETPICTHPAAQSNPAIYGDKIIWRDTRNGGYIYM